MSEDYKGIIEQNSDEAKQFNKDVVFPEEPHSHQPEQLQAQKQHTEDIHQISEQNTETTHHKDHKVKFDPYKKSYHDYIKSDLEARGNEKNKQASTEHAEISKEHIATQLIDDHPNSLIGNEKTIKNENSHMEDNEDQLKRAEYNREETVNTFIIPKIQVEEPQQKLVEKEEQKLPLQVTISHNQNIPSDSHQQNLDKIDDIEQTKPIQKETVGDYKQTQPEQINLINKNVVVTLSNDHEQKIIHQEQPKLQLPLEEEKILQPHQQQRPKHQYHEQYAEKKQPLDSQEVLLNKSPASHPLALTNHCGASEHVEKKIQIPEEPICCKNKDPNQMAGQIVNQKEVTVEKPDEGHKLSIDSSKQKPRQQQKNDGNPSTCNACEVM